jgi:photosystem II stability/assembly factor-like uncharacterized protein
MKAGGPRVPSSFDAAFALTPSHILAISGGELFESTDAGRTWRRKNLISDEKGDVLAIGGYEGDSWTVLGGERSIPISRQEFSSLPNYAQDGSSSAQCPRIMVPDILTSRNAGVTWQTVALPKAIGPIDEVAVSGSFAVALGPYVVLISKDSGQVWSAILQKAIEEDEDSFPVDAAIFGDRLWISFKNGDLIGGSITKLDFLRISKSSSALGPLTFVSSRQGFALENDDLVETADGGAIWVPLTHSKDVRALSGTQSGVFGIAGVQLFQVELVAQPVAPK